MKVGQVSVKQVVISSYSDLSNLSPEVKHVHFRKFISKKILERVISKCSELEEISLSRYAYNRCASDFLNLLSQTNIEVKISAKGVGRPSIIDKMGAFYG